MAKRYVCFPQIVFRLNCHPGFGGRRHIRPAATYWVAALGQVPPPAAADTEMRRRKMEFDNQTIRLITHISLGGQEVRIRLANYYGTKPIAIGEVHLALRSSGASIQELRPAGDLRRKVRRIFQLYYILGGLYHVAALAGAVGVPGASHQPAHPTTHSGTNRGLRRRPECACDIIAPNAPVRVATHRPNEAEPLPIRRYAPCTRISVRSSAFRLTLPLMAISRARSV